MYFRRPHLTQLNKRHDNVGSALGAFGIIPELRSLSTGIPTSRRQSLSTWSSDWPQEEALKSVASATSIVADRDQGGCGGNSMEDALTGVSDSNLDGQLGADNAR
jgi:hypothetical protein